MPQGETETHTSTIADGPGTDSARSTLRDRAPAGSSWADNLPKQCAGPFTRLGDLNLHLSVSQRRLFSGATTVRTLKVLRGFCSPARATWCSLNVC